MITRETSACVALLRGINVGGNNLLPMKDLAKMFADAGCLDVKTYIQSGNVVFSAPGKVLKELPSRIGADIEARFGHRPPVILRTLEQIEDAIRQNPFIAAGKPEEALFVYFLAEQPRPEQVRKLDPDRSPPDVYSVRGRDIYVHLPNGMAKTKLSNAYFDAKLGTVSTARNWRTVLKIDAMLRSI